MEKIKKVLGSIKNRSKKVLNWSISSWETILLAIGLIIGEYVVFIYWENIGEFFKTYIEVIPEKKDKLQLWQIIAGVGATLTVIAALRRASSMQKQAENQTQQLKNEITAEQNKQFLEVIKLFDDAKSLEAKKGALFHLENLALSSPAHRQRVLDFINSLNSWMRKYEDELFEIDIAKFAAWKNKGELLLEENIVEKNIQLLSTETPKIFENIIRKHNKEYLNFSEKEKNKYRIDFSYFVFPEIDFFNMTFSQEMTCFKSCLFLGKSKFDNTKFKYLDMSYSTIYDGTFRSCIITDTAFFMHTYFKDIEFMDFKYSIVNFYYANFQECKIKKQHIHLENDFICLELYKKIQEYNFFNKIFSDEQIAYFKNLEDKQNKS